ncbi:uroporphyrinogen decarboxylase family protein [Desulfofundulus thermosubterraneus]|uniref:Uroporphyrinogen decarboxylase n=1 Tax=Desulfofundulus thermosubterraneus DSM 16057 TaxID=1121432 RepID=A0A1M6HX48_9FIRM|nr:uroporphyrinogen decarboxylase family protein [Desulfofundulus thermosubterraneus]SHJ26829.1 uroporphyrinogen decarboxylase [Desulfofundulus thermosubterraneus DSM 16057]
MMLLKHKGEEMTSVERVVAALNYQKPDRVPVAPLLCGAARRVNGVTYPKWATDAEACAEAYIQSVDLFDYDVIVGLVDLSVESADWGQATVFPPHSTPYTDTNKPFIKNEEDYYRLEKINPRETPRMKMVLETMARVVKARGKEKVVCGFIYGPLGVLSQLRGHERLFKDCLKRPEAVKAGLEVVTEVLCDYARAMIETGVHAIAVDTLYACKTIMSKKMWENIEGPYAKKLCDVIRDAGITLALHNCGGATYFDAQIKWLNPQAISHAYPADDCKDWAEHAAKWGKKVVTMGYLVPSELGLIMTPEQVIEECRREIETFKDCDGGFILAPGCEFPPNGSLLNLAAIMQAARTYGVYH